MLFLNFTNVILKDTLDKSFKLNDPFLSEQKKVESQPKKMGKCLKLSILKIPDKIDQSYLVTYNTQWKIKILKFHDRN